MTTLSRTAALAMMIAAGMTTAATAQTTAADTHHSGVMAIHKRIFDRVGADKDGKATPEEIQTFLRE